MPSLLHIRLLLNVTSHIRSNSLRRFVLNFNTCNHFQLPRRYQIYVGSLKKFMAAEIKLDCVQKIVLLPDQKTTKKSYFLINKLRMKLIPLPSYRTPKARH